MRLISARLTLLLALLFRIDFALADVLDVKDIKDFSVGQNALYFQTAEAKSAEEIYLDRDNLPFQKPKTSTLSFGYSNDDFWFMVELNNSSRLKAHRLFEVHYPVLDEIDVHIFDEVSGNLIKSYATGDTRPYDSRPLPTKSFVFPFDVDPGGDIVALIRVKSRSSIFVPLNIWSEDSFESYRDNSNFFNGIYFGTLIVMCLYNFFVYLVIRHPSYLNYSLVVACTFVFQATLQGVGYKYIWTQVPWFNAKGVNLFVALISGFSFRFCIEFLQLKSGSRRSYLIVRGSEYTCWLLALLSILLPDNVSVRLTTIMALLGPVILMAVGIRISLQGNKSARIFTMAWVSFLIGTMGLALSRLGVIETNVVTEYGQQVGSGIEVVLLSLSMANRLGELRAELSIANKNLEHHIQNVEHIVQQKTRKIRSILKNIRQGIFTIGTDLRVEDESSDHLREILDTSDITGQKIDRLFLDKTSLGNDEKDQIMSAVSMSLGELSFTFESNSDLLKKEVTILSDNGNKILEVAWDPIEDPDTEFIESILVSIRDVTLDREAEVKKREQQELLNIISEILNISEDEYIRFIRDAKEMLNEVDHLLDEGQFGENQLRMMYMNMHTLKGTTRNYGFKKLTDLIHDAEQTYSDNLKGVRELDLDKLRMELKLVQDSFRLYKNVGEEKLGRSGSVSTGISINDAHQIISHLEKINKNASPGMIRDIQHKVESILKPHYYRPVRSVIIDKLNPVKKLCYDLGRAETVVSVEENSVGVDVNYEILLSKILVHLMRNSAFHGIEPLEVRESSGKSMVAHINVEVLDLGDHLEITYVDDGAGLNLRKIRERINLVGIDFTTFGKEAVEMFIFKEGTSTAEVENNIAGRGIGMSSIKKFIEEVGGTISLVYEGDDFTADYMPFSIHITLPPPHFTSLKRTNLVAG